MTDTQTAVNGRMKRNIPEGIWIQCPDCKKRLVNKVVEKALRVCPGCDHHMYVSAKLRIEQVLDEGTFEEWDGNLIAGDPLEFTDSRAYTDRLKSEREKTGLTDAAITGTGMIRARRGSFGIQHLVLLPSKKVVH